MKTLFHWNHQKRHFIAKWGVMLMMVILASMGITSVLSASVEVPRKEAGLQSHPVAATVVIYKGAHTCLNTSGYLVPAANTEGYRYAGVAYEKVTGGTYAGDVNCRVYTAGVFKMTATASITQAMVGRTMYITDDSAFTSTSGHVACGRLIEYISATSGWLSLSTDGELMGYQDHVYIKTDLATKSVRINNKTFINTSGDITGARIAPRQGATSTGSVRGLEVIPGGSAAASSFGFANLQGVISECYGNTIGNITGIVAAFEGKVDMPSGYPGTVTGPVSILRCFNDMHGDVTNGVFVLDVANHGGNKAWDGLVRGAEALGTHSMTTASDKTGSAKSGTIKVNFNGTLYHIQLYAD